jgi:hypothetical protein
VLIQFFSIGPLDHRHSLENKCTPATVQRVAVSVTCHVLPINTPPTGVALEAFRCLCHASYVSGASYSPVVATTVRIRRQTENRAGRMSSVLLAQRIKFQNTKILLLVFSVLSTMAIPRIDKAAIFLCIIASVCPSAIDAFYVPIFTTRSFFKVGRIRQPEEINTMRFNGVKLKLMLSPFSIDEVASAVADMAQGESMQSIISSLNIAAASAEATAAASADMFFDGDAAGNEFLDISTLPADVAVPLSEYFTEKHEEFSYMDIMGKAPLAASLLAIFDFAINRLLVDDVEENLRQEEMDGDTRAENTFFLSRLGIRVFAILAVSLATVFTSKLTYDNPF